MSADEDTTFSLEVRSFPTSVEDRKLPAALALALGISEPEARDMIRHAPVVVKQAADAATTKRLASMLVRFGAEVMIRNEQTGHEKAHGGLSTRPPPPDAAEAPPSVGPVEMCASCARAVDQAEMCKHCGWHNGDKKRYCSQCTKNLAAGSDFFAQKKPLVAVIAIVGVALAALGLLYFGAFAASAAVGFVLGVTWIGSSLAISYRCESCGRKVESYSLGADETKVLATARLRTIVLGAVFAVAGLGLVVPALAGVPDLFMDSFGVGWRASAPFTHRESERRVLTVATEAGPQRVTMQRRHHARFAVESYVLMHTIVPESARLSADDARLEALLKKVVEAGVGGSLGATEVVSVDGKQARQGTFEATEGQKKLAGTVRALVFERNVVIILFVASGEGAATNSAGLSFLDSLVTVKP